MGVISIFNFEIIPIYADDSSGSYSPPFNSSEIYSTNISPFYKWTSVLARMDARTKPLQPWLDNKEILESLPSWEMAQKVNDIINKYKNIADLITWGKNDYWETPAEFFAHGGDCEDFVIAKYAWLRFLGISEDRLRIAVVYDRIKSIPHAVLILYINGRAMILDSQVKEIRDSNTDSRYRLIYSINRLGWWYPTSSRDIEDRVGSAMQFSEDCLTGHSLLECSNAIEPAAR
jgi:predicted transglutaminase-like cysteine proteinase